MNTINIIEWISNDWPMPSEIQTLGVKDKIEDAIEFATKTAKENGFDFKDVYISLWQDDSLIESLSLSEFVK